MTNPLALRTLSSQSDWQAGDVAAVDTAAVPGSVVLPIRNLQPQAVPTSMLKTAFLGNAPAPDSWVAYQYNNSSGLVIHDYGVRGGGLYIYGTTSVSAIDLRIYSPQLVLDRTKAIVVSFKHKFGPNDQRRKFEAYLQGQAVSNFTSSQMNLLSNSQMPANQLTVIPPVDVEDGYKLYEFRLAPNALSAGSGNALRLFWGSGWNDLSTREFYIKDLQIEYGTARTATTGKYAPSAALTTRVLDLSCPRPSVNVVLDESKTLAASIGVTWRTSRGDGVWTPWAPLDRSLMIDTQRYVELKANLQASPNGLETPQLNALTLEMGGILLEIGGVDRTAMILEGSISLPDRINERSEFSCTLLTDSDYIPEPLEPVKVWDAPDSLAFEGFVWDHEDALVAERLDSDKLFVNLKCVDVHLLPDRRLVGEVYENKTAGFIFQDLVTKYLAEDGVVCEIVDDGPPITKAVFNYQTVSRCFDDLAELVGFFWQIRPGRKAWFRDRASYTAPWAINDSSPISHVRVRRQREHYRNRQLVRAGQGTTDPRTDRFKGDGENRNFTLAYPVATEPSITVNGVPILPSEIGIRGVEEDKKWYWNKNDKVISLDSYYTPLSDTDVVEVTYRGLFPIVIEYTDFNELADRVATEGGSGLYEAIESAPQLDEMDPAMELAKAKVDRYAILDGELLFDTTVSGLKAGQILPVDLTKFQASGDWLIAEVTMNHLAGNNFVYQVRAVAGDAVGGWVDFFEKLSLIGKDFTIRENEVLIKLKGLPDVMGISDSITIERAEPKSEVGFAEIGFSTIW